MSNKSKYNIRVLPVFIFMAVLSLTIKINNVFDSFKNPEASKISIGTNISKAQEKARRETAQLNQILDGGSSALPNGATGTESKFTQSEIIILQELAERREALDIRSKEIDKKAIQLKVAEEEIDKKLKQLQDYEQKLKKLINTYNDKERQQLNSLVKMYASMKPKEAARIFDTLDLEILIAILREMKPTESSGILAQMNPMKAKAVTTELISSNL